MSKRKHSFDNYRKNHKSNRLEQVRFALSILKHTPYKNITALSKSAAVIINELELKCLADKTNYIKLSHITLLRNPDYRLLLEIHLNGLQSSDNSVSDLELLQIHCTNLEVQNEALKNRLITLDASLFNVPDSNKYTLEEQKQYEVDIDILLYIINKIMEETSEIFIYGDKGLYSPMDELIIASPYLQRLDELNKKKRNVFF